MRLLIFAIASSLLSTGAQAHVGVGDTHGLTHGFMHPFSGVDHQLAMIAVGVLAAQWGGRALWVLPLSFLTMMGIGGALGTIGMPLPFVETGIGLSVVVLGAMIACGVSLPVGVAATTVGLFALFHGHAHGAEMPATGSAIAYGAGFIAATAILHGFGMGMGLLLGQAGGQRKRLAQLAGGAMSLAGIGILAGSL